MSESGYPGWKLSLGMAIALGGAIALSSDTAWAQSRIVPDSTLGAESSTVNLVDSATDEIRGGAIRGSNLFHSFLEFNVGEGRGVYFANPTGIENILSRVIGTSRSEILGKLGVLGNANLFLINPNGIVFGPNASLDVRGSFVASTASSFKLADSTFFSATQPQTTPLLTISVPVGLQYESNAGSLQVQGSRLEMQPGRTLALVGGNVSIDGGQMLAPGGRVELGGLLGEGAVGLNVDSGLSFPQETPRGDVLLTNGSEVNVRAGGGGNIVIHARNLDMFAESRLLAGITAGFGSPDAKAGNIQMNATDAIALDGSSAISDVEENAVGQGGNIDVTTGSLALTNGAQLSSSTRGQGKGGNINITARNTVSFDGVGSNEGSSVAASTVGELAVGNGGDINITTGSLAMTNGGLLIASTFGQGNAGSINITARDTVSFDGVHPSRAASVAASSVEDTGVGNGGDINITAGSLSVTNGAFLTAGTRGQGNAGNINITTRDIVSFDGESQAFTKVTETAVGNGGDINIITASLGVTNGAQLLANTEGQGNAGSINITARDTISFDGVGSSGLSSAAFSTVEETGVGSGGGIHINTGSLAMTNGAALVASTLGQGNAGNITITARDTVSFDGVGSNSISSAAFSTVEAGAVGNGGSVNITSRSLSVINGGLLIASTRGRGDAGSIIIRATDTVAFNAGDALSEVGTQAEGNGGNIDITTGSLALTSGAQLSSSTEGKGNAGSVTLTARDRISFDGFRRGNSGVFVLTFGEGNGGSIDITTGSLSVTNGAMLVASTFAQGNAGTVNITARNTVSFDGIWFDRSSGDVRASAIISTVGEDAVGNGGSINITTGSLSVTNGAGLSTSSDGNGAAGNINLKADSIGLDNEAEISADTVGGQGNISLRSPLLTLRHNSSITTNAEETNIPGGNVTLDIDVLAALEDSDISANSQDFRGGNITINAQGIFGTQYREAPTPESDITATGANSSLSGTVQINTPDIDPSRGLVQLPNEPVNVQVAQGCQTGGESSVAFFDLGRGGLAPDPYEPLSSNNIWEDVPTSTGESVTPTSRQRETPATFPDKISEAQGWGINEKRQVVLVAETSSSRSLSRCRLR